MSDRDDDQRRFMTPPAEWGDDSDALDNDQGWLGTSSPADGSNPTQLVDADDAKADWLGTGSPTDGSNPTQPVDANDAEAVWLDQAEADDYVNTPHDEGRAAVKHDDEFVVELNEGGFDERDADESAFEADDLPPTGDSIEPDILTDHHLARTSTRAKRSLWPVLTAGCALILVVIGGWGAITERSALTARIAELEAAKAKTPQRGDLSSDEEQALLDENQWLTTQLDQLREQFSSMSQELSELEAALSSGLTASQPVESVAAINPKNEVPSTSQEQPSSDTSNDKTNIEGWFVNVAAYSQASAAQSWVDRLAASVDGTVVSSTVVVNEKTLYRVRVVGLADRATAQALASSLESTYNIGPLWVGRAEASLNQTNSKQPSPKETSSTRTNPAKKAPTSANPDQAASKPVELRNFSTKGGWFIYIDTFSQSADADAKAGEIQRGGYDAKVAVEYRSGELFYRVQVVGINSREEGEAIAQALSALGDMPNLQLRQY